MAHSYPKPSRPTWTWIDPQHLLPIYPPPEPLISPTLPFQTRQPALDAPYILTNHVIPATFLRSPPDIPTPCFPPEGGSSVERRSMILKTGQELIKIREDVAMTKLEQGYPKILWNCVNRYVREDQNKTGITLFFVHANGFPKEIWEPTLNHLLTTSASRIIAEVWTWEAVQHGDSALLNAGSLGGIFSATDGARDILNFLLHYLPSSAAPSILPTNLSRIPVGETEQRRLHGFKDRTFVTIGHSVGGLTSALAALTYPKFFSSLILVDPLIVRPMYYEEANDSYLLNFALRALQRRDTWESKAQAFQMFSKSPFFCSWDPAVLEVYVEHGLYPDDTGVVHLKMPSIQEAAGFLDTQTSYDVWQRLEDLDEKVALRWVLPGKVGSETITGPKETQERVWRREKNASNVCIPNAGHLIPQEAPLELAHEIRDFLQSRYSVPKANL